ncbi:hypothetical protein NQ117_07345 [Paenibacillus sp. SC116]|uniref:hypothetical protein n=1 Tax=Paenibacillus sp. SC116 TaxID=2968986 RepID=UPI00215B48D5|nr:hypothetical protein [Paenibacillus sp. SC116]MCR8843495.1 hypothetical protein [Paenibacillus sp. SC116]
MKNQFLTFILFVLIVATMSACGQKHSTAPKEVEQPFYGMVSVATHYMALEELAYDAEYIVEAEWTNKTERVNVSGANFELNDIKINKVLEGDPKLAGQTIKIIDIGSLNSAPHTKSVLFLNKYDGPITEEAYAVVGYYQGIFAIDDDNEVVYDADKYGGVKHFQGSLEGMSMESFEQRIQQAVKNARPSMWNKPQLSEEEQKRAEEESHKLYLEDKKRLEEQLQDRETKNK